MCAIVAIDNAEVGIDLNRFLKGQFGFIIKLQSIQRLSQANEHSFILRENSETFTKGFYSSLKKLFAQSVVWQAICDAAISFAQIKIAVRVIRITAENFDEFVHAFRL